MSSINNLFCFLLLAAFCSIDAQLQTVNGRIKMSILTTAGCGDTVRFITQQLPNAFQRYSGYLDVDFVPWGKTTRNQQGLQCQFGANDCRANRMHRCVLEKLKGNQVAQVNYMVCEFSDPRPAFTQGSYKCAQSAGLRLADLDYCMTTTGDSLEVAAEAASAEPMAAHYNVPNILFNEQVNATLSRQAEAGLVNLICLALAEDPTSGINNCPV